MSTKSTVKAAKRAQAASSAAAVNATKAAQNAGLAAQNAATLAQAAAQNAAVVATGAAHNAGGAAQTAASAASRGVKQGVYTARSWAAPRLDIAAEYCTTTVAPKVSSALHSTARQVAPVDTRASKKSSIMTWSLLGGAILAAVGAAAAVVRYRYRAAIEADSEPADEEVLGDSTGSQAAAESPDAANTKAAMPTDPKRAPKDETSVNGRVTASGW
ncbi:MAG TPA: hypothetical protein VN714_09710 [Trebonia sp.]|nr:hypothetical protein [Trebonia sp.]